MCEKRCGQGGVRALSGGDGSGMHGGGPDSRLGGQGTRGAHVEHPAHVRDLGRVDAERLVERLRVLPRVERWACGAKRGTAREA